MSDRRPFEDGEYRWIRGQDAAIWHMTHDGRVTLCEAGAPPSPMETALGQSLGHHPDDFGQALRCTECRAQARSLFGLGKA